MSRTLVHSGNWSSETTLNTVPDREPLLITHQADARLRVHSERADRGRSDNHNRQNGLKDRNKTGQLRSL